MPFGAALDDRLFWEPVSPGAASPAGGLGPPALRTLVGVPPPNFSGWTSNQLEAYVKVYTAGCELELEDKRLEQKKLDVRLRELDLAAGGVTVSDLGSVPPRASSPALTGSSGGSRVGKFAAGVRAWRSSVTRRAESAKSWRSGPASSVSGFSTEGGAQPAGSPACRGGRCYAALAAEGRRSSLVRRCGKWPSVSRLLALPSSEVSMAKLSQYVLVRSDGNRWHVACQEEYPPAAATVSDVFSRLVRERGDVLQVGDPRWDGTLLREVSRLPESLGTFDLPELTSTVGGLGPSVVYEVYPETVETADLPVLFLGGSVEKDRSSPGWRSGFVELAGSSFPPCLVKSPRPLGAAPFDDADDAKRQWERDSMDRADVVFLNFLPGSSSGVSLMELGLYACSSRLVVCCPLGSSRYPSVRHACERAGVPLFLSLGEAVTHLAAALRGVRPVAGVGGLPAFGGASGVGVGSSEVASTPLGRWVESHAGVVDDEVFGSSVDLAVDTADGGALAAVVEAGRSALRAETFCLCLAGGLSEPSQSVGGAFLALPQVLRSCGLAGAVRGGEEVVARAFFFVAGALYVKGRESLGKFIRSTGFFPGLDLVSAGRSLGACRVGTGLWPDVSSARLLYHCPADVARFFGCLTLSSVSSSVSLVGSPYRFLEHAPESSVLVCPDSQVGYVSSLSARTPFGVSAIRGRVFESVVFVSYDLPDRGLPAEALSDSQVRVLLTSHRESLGLYCPQGLPRGVAAAWAGVSSGPSVSDHMLVGSSS